MGILRQGLEVFGLELKRLHASFALLQHYGVLQKFNSCAIPYVYHEIVTTIPPTKIKIIATITCRVRSREPKNHPLKITMAIF